MPKLNDYDDYFFTMLYIMTKMSALKTQKIVLYTILKNSEKQSYREINPNNRYHSYCGSQRQKHTCYSSFLNCRKIKKIVPTIELCIYFYARGKSPARLFLFFAPCGIIGAGISLRAQLCACDRSLPIRSLARQGFSFILQAREARQTIVRQVPA
ncbi:MAG: hypothetical protein J6B02_02490 [Selenomonadales bacterium]|nr:hypothetical protein [Selenomonadales bacterium]